jgi:shikimate 5-dehydrogenase
MLVHQAVEQLRRWTERLPEPPSADALEVVVDVMARAFDEAGRSTEARE